MRKEPIPLNHLSVARSVAASSAFPVLFSPVRIDNSDCGGRNVFAIPQLFADGGIYEFEPLAPRSAAGGDEPFLRSYTGSTNGRLL